MKKITKYIGTGLALQLLPLAAFAQNTFTVEDLIRILTNIQNWFAAIVGIIGVIMILYAAFLFMTAAGDEEKVKKARGALIWGLVGIGVAILAYAAFSFVMSVLG